MPALNEERPNHHGRGSEIGLMGIVVEFPSNAGSSRPAARAVLPPESMGQVVILPVIRIERYGEETNGRDPEQGATAGRRRRRRARS